MQTPLHIILRTSFWQQPQQQRHMHKVFSANRAVLCLDGTHCSALSLHVCLCGPQSLFRLSCRADTPQTHRPTRIHKHNKQWRLSSSSFIPRPKHTHTRTHGHAHAPVHTQTAFLWGTQMLNVLWVLFISVLRQMYRDHSSVWFTVWKALHSHCVHKSASHTCPQITFLHGLAGVFTSFLTHYLHTCLKGSELHC